MITALFCAIQDLDALEDRASVVVGAAPTARWLVDVENLLRQPHGRPRLHSVPQRYDGGDRCVSRVVRSSIQA
jgi:hypothetical protein